jgi:ADP-heptose:LPS heptosyltransferase
MTHRLSFNPFLHASEIFQIQVQALELPPEKFPACDLIPSTDGTLPDYRPDADRVAEVEAMLRDALRTDHVPPIVLVNANCGDLLPLRRWPTEHFVELARRVLSRYPEAAIVFTGSPEEAADSQALAESVASDRCLSLAGRTTFAQLIALYGLSDLLVTNDSGPAHYATLTPIEVITLFGPETPAVFGSRSPHSHILWAGIACSPCVNAFNDRQSSCRDNICMQRIGVDEVFELACRVYDKRQAALRQR